MDTETLVAALREIQETHGWSDRRMGRELGVNHTTWHYVRRGLHGPGVKFLRCAVARWPELQGLLLLPVGVSVTNQIGQCHEPDAGLAAE